MKRAVSLFLCVLLAVLTFTGCNLKKLDPKEAYQAAAQKTSELTAIDTTMEMSLAGEVAGESIDINMDLDMKMAPKEDNDVDMALKMTYKMMGVTMEIPIYYTNGYAYLDAFGQQIKTKADIDDLQTEQTSASMQIFEDAFFKEITSGEQKDGSTTFTFTGDPDQLGAMKKSIMDQLDSSLGDANIDVTFGEVTGSFVIDKDGYLSQETINLTIDMEAEGETVSYQVEVTIKINNPGQTVTIDFPDFSGYQESNLDLDSLFSNIA